MNDHDRIWERLAAAARGAHGGPDESAPFGFSTRVAARAMVAPAPAPWALFEKFAVRGLIAACAFSLAAVAFGYAAWAGDHENDVASDDAVAEVLDLTS
jgi:hypothetical protein